MKTPLLAKMPKAEKIYFEEGISDLLMFFSFALMPSDRYRSCLIGRLPNAKDTINAGQKVNKYMSPV